MKIATLTISLPLIKAPLWTGFSLNKSSGVRNPSFEPGGGGINVSRADKILGRKSL